MESCPPDSNGVTFFLVRPTLRNKTGGTFHFGRCVWKVHTYHLVTQKEFEVEIPPDDLLINT